MPLPEQVKKEQDVETSKAKTALYLNGADENSISLYRDNNIFSRKDQDRYLFNDRFRFGFLNAYDNITTAREYLFFTKPDLNIIEEHTMNLTEGLKEIPFWIELQDRYNNVISMLQSSYGSEDPFNHLLENTVQSNLDMPGISAEMIDTPTNMYGVNYKYRGSSEASDDGHTFSLEFKDTRNLPVYYFFKAYEEYETLKHHGVVGPKSDYIFNKILHDQYSIYKFLVDEDGESIIYYAKYYGVKSVNLPRDVFNNTNFDNGISYSIDFDAAFVEDMNPQILTDFNSLSYPYVGEMNDIDIYNPESDRADNRPAKGALIVKDIDNGNGSILVGSAGKIISSGPKKVSRGGGFNKTQSVYKLKWKGDA